MEFLLEKKIPKNQHIVMLDEKYHKNIEKFFGYKLDILKQAPSYPKFIEMNTFEDIKDKEYNTSLSGFRLYFNFERKILGSKKEDLKSNILSVSDGLIRIDGLIITPKLRNQLKVECKNILDAKTALLWASMPRPMFEMIAMKNDPADVQRLCMTNQKLRNWCDRDFYARMLMHYFNEESDDPKSRFIQHLYPQIWGFGYNYHGQLGLGNRLNQQIPTLIPFEGRVTTIACGGYHSMILDSEGRVWSFGQNEDGQLGRDIYETAQDIPQMIPFEGRVTAISSGSRHSMILDSEGQVWSFGKNRDGQLGLGHTYGRSDPQLISLEERVTTIACGGYHSMILDSEGQVWSFGRNQYGQLGLGHDDNQNTPQLIPFEGRVTAISCGNSHSMILDSEGQVWSFGSNVFGQLGLAHNDNQNTPQLIPFEGRVTAIACGYNHSMILDSQGQVWSFGENKHGQLGLYRTRADHNTPQLIKFNGKIIAISCGISHSIIIDSKNKAWSFGWNYDGLLGIGFVSGDEGPRKILFDGKIIASSCGIHSLIIGIK